MKMRYDWKRLEFRRASVKVLNEVLARGDSYVEAVEAERQLGRYATSQEIIEHNIWMLDYLESGRRKTPCPIINSLTPKARAAIRANK